MENNKINNVDAAIKKLGEEFPNLNWNFQMDASHELVSGWLGELEEQVMVCVFHGKQIDEPFHRQDFFFLNFAYRGDYSALSNSTSSAIVIKEGDLYMGQPYSGYAIKANSDKEVSIIGLLIRKEVFFREFLPTLTLNDAMYRFFLSAETHEKSQEYLHLSFDKNDPLWTLLELAILEYANRSDDTPSILKPMALSICMMVARKWKKSIPLSSNQKIIDQILDYIIMHSDNVSLSKLSMVFGYHPNYISNLLHKETEKTFSEIVLEARMKRASLLLQETDLSIEEISFSLGYSNASNFYKAYKKYYGKAPRKN